MTEEIKLNTTTFIVELSSCCQNCGFVLKYKAEARTIEQGVEVCIDTLKSINAIHTVSLPIDFSNIDKFDICSNCKNIPIKNK